jgi:hypothetical protein
VRFQARNRRASQWRLDFPDGRWFNFPTQDARNSNGHFSFTGRGMTERTHEQIFASLSGVFVSSTTAIMNGHITYAGERWRIWTERGKVYVKPSSVELLPPPVVFPGAAGGSGGGAPAAEGVSRSHAARTSDAADRLGGFSTGRGLLSVPTSFSKLRLVVLFDQAVCTAEEWTIYSNIKSMFDVVWSHNMKMTNWEIMYRCQALTDGSGTMDRNSFAAAARKQVDFRRKYGADVLLVIGQFTYEQWWRAGGDLGPSPTAVTTSTREAAAEILVIPHEVCFLFKGVRLLTSLDRWGTTGAWTTTERTAFRAPEPTIATRTQSGATLAFKTLRT